MITNLQIDPPRILILDGDPAMVRTLTRLLEDEGELFFALSGETGLRLAEEKAVDVVLLDAEMADMDGYAVCARLKSRPETADIAVIFVTAHGDIEHETRALAMGAVDFITKPINPPVVRARVHTHVMLKRQADVLRCLAATDGLTGVANRRHFDEVLDREWKRARRHQRPLALLMADVDHFKAYNDRYGHQAGDDCLRAVASALAGVARRPGDLIARYGGEEFAAILPELDLAEARLMAERAREAVVRLTIPHDASRTATIVTISIGVAATVPEGEGESAAFIRAADRALYCAKCLGRDRVVTTEEAAKSCVP